MNTRPGGVTWLPRRMGSDWVLSPFPHVGDAAGEPISPVWVRDTVSDKILGCCLDGEVYLLVEPK